jgi:hypothetical protein
MTKTAVADDDGDGRDAILAQVADLMSQLGHDPEAHREQRILDEIAALREDVSALRATAGSHHGCCGHHGHVWWNYYQTVGAVTTVAQPVMTGTTYGSYQISS